MRRRWLWLVCGALATLVVAIASLPFWAGAVTRAVAAPRGVTFARYERIGYARFALHDVEIRRPAAVVRVARIELDTPVLLAWRHLRGRSQRITAGTWSVDVQKQAPREPRHDSGWLPLRSQLQRLADGLSERLPLADVGAGVVRWPAGEVSLAGANWKNGTLEVQGLRYRGIGGDATVRFAQGGDLIAMTFADRERGLALELESRGPAVAGVVRAWEQKVDVSARFDAAGWVPAEADVRAPKLNVAADRLRLAPAYQAVTGHVQLEWRNDHFVADVALHGEPAKDRGAAPLAVEARARGDATAVTIEALNASIPGGTARLNQPVVVERSGRLRSEAAQFSIEYDLSKQPWLGAGGTISGEARILKSDTQTPVVEFQLQGREVAARDVRLKRVDAVGTLAWPWLRVTKLAILGENGDEATLAGGWDFRTREVEALRLAGSVTRGSVARWLPPGVEFDRVTVNANASGAWGGLRHEGDARLDGFRRGALHPTNLTVSWRGTSDAIESFTAEAITDTGRLAARGSATRTAVRLTELSLSVRDAGELKLTQPARIAWKPVPVIESVHLAGPDASLEAQLRWAEVGEVKLALRGFRSEWLAAFVRQPRVSWRVTSFALDGSWSNGPMVFSAAGAANVDLGQNRMAAVNVSVRGDAGGLTLEALRALEGGNAVLNASGVLPLRITPGGERLLALDARGEMQLDASTVPNAAFWTQLGQLSGVELRSPQVGARLRGTWEQPRGELTFRADRAVMDPKRFARPMPSLESVDLAATGDSDGIHLERLAFAVEGQLVRLTGQLPITRSGWPAFLRRPLPVLQQASHLRLEIPNAEVGKFSRFLPAALAPAGRLQAELQINRGELAGFVRLRDAASRPLGPLGVLQQITADVEFLERRIELRQVTATTGGQPVTLSGSVTLPSGDWLDPGAQPRYDVSLRGTNLPFVRQSGLLLRGDLDLALKSPRSGPPAITGSVRLRDSLFLADVRAYLPQGGGAGPSRRPPFFSVQTSPLDTWRLAIDVVGTRFMRVRMPVFSGVASARFQLSGTLGDPRALGSVTIDEGQVLMPFASFEVKQGAVRLTEESPHEPVIYLRGAGRHWGYDLGMEVSGKASAPKITFTSNPALDSDEVLLMVMTGAAPRNEMSSSLTHRAVQIGAFFGQTLVGSLTGSSARPDRLSFESGERISRQGKETYEIEYKLNDRWTVTGEYDEFDEYNAGFKWRIAPRKGRR